LFGGGGGAGGAVLTSQELGPSFSRKGIRFFPLEGGGGGGGGGGGRGGRGHGAEPRFHAFPFGGRLISAGAFLGGPFFFFFWEGLVGGGTIKAKKVGDPTPPGDFRPKGGLWRLFLGRPRSFLGGGGLPPGGGGEPGGFTATRAKGGGPAQAFRFGKNKGGKNGGGGRIWSGAAKKKPPLGWLRHGILRRGEPAGMEEGVPGGKKKGRNGGHFFFSRGRAKRAGAKKNWPRAFLFRGGAGNLLPGKKRKGGGARGGACP